MNIEQLDKNTKNSSDMSIQESNNEIDSEGARADKVIEEPEKSTNKLASDGDLKMEVTMKMVSFEGSKTESESERSEGPEKDVNEQEMDRVVIEEGTDNVCAK